MRHDDRRLLYLATGGLNLAIACGLIWWKVGAVHAAAVFCLAVGIIQAIRAELE